MAVPIVAIVGRPNVGKSSLLNCMVRRLVSIVEPTAGVTRDRVSALLDVDDRYIELVDTGGYGVDDQDNLTEHVERQISYAVEAASLILFVVDVKTGIHALDRRVGELLRRTHHDKVLLVGNKADRPGDESLGAEFIKLGFGEPILVSALHSMGRWELFEAITERIGDQADTHIEPIMKAAVIGRQNTGKSTFINALAGEEHVIVSEVPGTTRDAIDLRFEQDGRTFVAIDTAGVKNRIAKGEPIEFYGYHRVLRSIRRADVCVLFIDSTQPISNVDKKLARYVVDELKPCVIVINKWDLAKDRATTDDYADYLGKTLTGLDYAPVVFASAKDAHNTDAVIDTAWSLFTQSQIRVSTGELNRALQEALSGRGPSPKRGSKPPKIYYATQVAVQPPSIVLFVNHPSLIKRNYQRYLLNRLQEHLPFSEVPIRLMFRPRRGSESSGPV